MYCFQYYEGILLSGNVFYTHNLIFSQKVHKKMGNTITWCSNTIIVLALKIWKWSQFLQPQNYFQIYMCNKWYFWNIYFPKSLWKPCSHPFIQQMLGIPTAHSGILLAFIDLGVNQVDIILVLMNYFLSLLIKQG